MANLASSVSQRLRNVTSGTRKALGLKSQSAPPTVPMPSDDEIDLARRRSVASQMARTGRVSTLLTTDAPLGE
jgi:hypothetical protein